ncbi:MAG: hypothetical protein H6819_10380 [Phycisphaerales bacterium]|nr:hypothetical protein [Phycisphaerales bacterium]MCB9855966.1 hypothetical protein [Phycisphaerales bacterium]
MEKKHSHYGYAIGTALIAPFYLVFLAVSSMFALGYSLFRSIVASRAPVANDVKTPSRLWVILLDASIALGAYLTADVLRCWYYQHTSWPEHLNGYGSTLNVHLTMMAVLPIAWTGLLGWIGWYGATSRTLRWKVVNTIAASILLGLFMGAFALVVARDAYPRMQIVCFGALLPIMTGIVRGIIDQVARRLNGEDRGGRHVGPAW